MCGEVGGVFVWGGRLASRVADVVITFVFGFPALDKVMMVGAGWFGSDVGIDV